MTTDLEKRVQDHQSGDGAQYTCARLPVSLKYSEQFKSKQEAESREKQLKRWSKVKKEALVSGNLSNLSKLSKSKFKWSSELVELSKKKS